MFRKPKPRYLLAGIAIATLGMLGVGRLTSAKTVADRVILISWDGVQRDGLQKLLRWQPLGETPKECPNAKHPPRMPQECNGFLTCVPNLCKFQIIDSSVVEGKPLTRPQHAQMLSGYGPPETGKITNAGRGRLPQGYSIYERIHAARPEVKLVHIAGRKYVSRGIVTWPRKTHILDFDLRRGGYDGFTGDKTTTKFVEALDGLGPDTPFFMLLHYKTVDIIGHRTGDQAKQYREAMVQIDYQLGMVLAELEKRGMRQNTEIYVTTDHGFKRNMHVNPNEPLITETWFASAQHNFDPTQSATVLDVTPTILDRLGISTANINPPYRGHSCIVPGY